MLYKNKVISINQNIETNCGGGRHSRPSTLSDYKHS